MPNANAHLDGFGATNNTVHVGVRNRISESLAKQLKLQKANLG